MILLAVLEKGAAEQGKGWMRMEGHIEYEHLYAICENINCSR